MYRQKRKEVNLLKLSATILIRTNRIDSVMRHGFLCTWNITDICLETLECSANLNAFTVYGQVCAAPAISNYAKRIRNPCLIAEPDLIGLIKIVSESFYMLFSAHYTHLFITKHCEKVQTVISMHLVYIRVGYVDNLATCISRDLLFLFVSKRDGFALREKLPEGFCDCTFACY